MDVVDVEGIQAARQYMRQTLANAHEAQLLSTYEKLEDTGAYAITPEAMARRQLRNVCLSYLSTLNKQDHFDRAHLALKNARSMTDEIAALGCVSHNENDGRQAALDAFAAKWKDDLLVMNKWFAVQAGSPLPQTLEAVLCNIPVRYHQSQQGGLWWVFLRVTKVSSTGLTVQLRVFSGPSTGGR